MILFVRKNCKFCKDLPPVAELKVMEVEDAESGRGQVVVMDPTNKVPLPPEIKGLPALLIGAELYIGKDVIKKRLEEFLNVAA